MDQNYLLNIIEDYTESVQEELKERWNKWSFDWEECEVHEVVGAIMARMVTLSIEFSRSPSVWNEHIAPIVLRTMADAYISLAWIMKDPVERSRKFILFGLGQAKLNIEHRKTQLEKDGRDSEDDPIVKTTEAWIDSQQYSFLTEVKLGSWSDLSTRKMAEDAECLDFYNHVYTPFSSAVHNTWHHVGRFNLQNCNNPLHGLHKLPFVSPLPSSLEYLTLAAKYMDKAFRLIDSKIGLQIELDNSYKKLIKNIKSLGKSHQLL